MSRRPQLEEVDDDELDTTDYQTAQFDSSLRTPIAPISKPTITRSQDDDDPPVLLPTPVVQKPVNASRGNEIMDPTRFSAEQREEIRHFQLLYPCYFDKNRSHREGRRVSAEQAVENPLAETIADACRQLKMPVLLELDKTHPQDFGNPGRVRVPLKEKGVAGDSRFPTKRALLKMVSKYLQEHPTTLDSIGKKSAIPYPQEFDQNFTPEALPKVLGMPMNTIVPIHSKLTLKHPMTKSIYDPEPQAVEAPKAPKQPKKKIMKIRG